MKLRYLEMKRTFTLLIVSLLVCIPTIWAQKGNTAKKGKEKYAYDITFNIKDAKDTIIYLCINFDGKLMLRDSAKPSAPGVYHFQNTKKIEEGFYSLVAQKRVQYASFIMEKDAHFTMDLDTLGNPKSLTVQGSPENEILVDFQKRTADAQQKISTAVAAKKRCEYESKKDSVEILQKQIDDINTEVLAYISSLIEQHPDMLFVKMQKAYQSIEVPDIMDEKGELDIAARGAYFRTHYWDNVDLNDGRMIFMPVLQNKAKEYFEKVLEYQEIDTINKYIDLTLALCTDTTIYKYMVSYVSHHYETSKNIGYDAIFVHIAKENQLKGKCTWLSEEIVGKYSQRVTRLEPLLIGKHAPEIIIPDTSDEWHSSHLMPKQYVILWFFDPDCPECRRETKGLRAVYDSLESAGTRNFDVFAVANDCTPERWKRYVKEEGHPWLVVGGNKGNIDYLEAYNTYETGNPTMFILNEKRDIICNKRIPTNMIPEFLSQYEKIEANKQKRHQK